VTNTQIALLLVVGIMAVLAWNKAQRERAAAAAHAQRMSDANEMVGFVGKAVAYLL